MSGAVSYKCPVCKKTVWVYQAFSGLKGSTCFECMNGGISQVGGTVQNILGMFGKKKWKNDLHRHQLLLIPYYFYDFFDYAEPSNKILKVLHKIKW